MAFGFADSSDSYLSIADRIVDARREMGRVTAFLSPAAPPAPAGTALVPAAGSPDRIPTRRAEFVQWLRKSGLVEEPKIGDGPGTAIGAALGLGVGAFLGHPILYGIGGASLGRNLPALFEGGLRDEALRNMGQTGAAVLMARIVPGSPVVGFVLGWILAGFAIWYHDRG